MVILLALAGSLAVVVLLDRQGASTASVRRQIDAYNNHHIAFGMREMISKWLRQFRGTLRDNLDQDGFAFALNLPGGNSVRVYMEDGQGLALSDTSNFTGRRKEILDFVSAYVQLNAQPEEVENLLRPAGPGVISLNTAPRAVLEALAAACVQPDQVQHVADTLASIGRAGAAEAAPSGAGGGGGILGEGLGAVPALNSNGGGASGASVGTGSGAINSSIMELNIPDQAKRELIALTTTRPTLWRVVCVEEDSIGPLWRAGGFMDLQPGRTNSTYDQGGAFLTWEQLPIDGASGR